MTFHPPPTLFARTLLRSLSVSENEEEIARPKKAGPGKKGQWPGITQERPVVQMIDFMEILNTDNGYYRQSPGQEAGAIVVYRRFRIDLDFLGMFSPDQRPRLFKNSLLFGIGRKLYLPKCCTCNELCALKGCSFMLYNSGNALENNDKV